MNTIRQTLANIDYDYKKPETYLVLVPGLSLVIQKMQMAKVLPFSEQRDPLDKVANEKAKHFKQICKWHLRGSMTQVLACLIATKAVALPIFSIITLLSFYEMMDTCVKGFKNRPFVVDEYKMGPHGEYAAGISYSSAINIF